MINIMKVLKSA